jgi:DNA-directed RNA polymerase specialized sigma24 family protein
MNFPVELVDWIENPKAREDGNVDRDTYGLQPFHPLPAVRKYATQGLRSRYSQESLDRLDILFSRYRRVLSMIAYRVLGNHEEAEDAVQNCIRVASDHAPRFDHEGAFRSWLVRVLINEAVAILYKQRKSTTEPDDYDCQSLLEPANQQREKLGFLAAAAT